MKKALLLLAMLFVVSNAFAQSGIESSTATTLSPFVTATRLMESATATALLPFASTSATVQARGVAGKEQLKDELVSLNDDIVAGTVKTIDEVRQPALKELFVEIAADEAQMLDISSAVKEGSKLHRIATAVTVTLLAE